ncbi:uncharacterized protein QYS62_001612 [Fusarium acuminatum]|uniref:Zn(2)-C6 fungal-type domain-containing protein n=1 Tax=Fusarium acuminatum TaxID=5515 RepID=A0ABZ2WJ60_9HYPO
MANQAWRKKPRQFAPKSRLGCKTCKIRRVKCDLAQPSCLKCKSTGRTCDGYPERTHLDGKFHVAQSLDRQSLCTTTSTQPSSHWQPPVEDSYGLGLHNPRPFMVLPVAEAGLTDAMSFFDHVSIKHLNKYQPSDEPWHQTLMYFSQTVPSVRYAAIALSLLHRSYIHGGSTSGTSLKSFKESRLISSEAPLLHYNMAIQHLLGQDLSGRDSVERTAITLLVCYLFTCFDHLTGNDVQAMKHLRGGVELSRNLNKVMVTNSSSTDLRGLISQVTTQIRRLDMQAVMFALDWTPADIQEPSIWQLLPSDIAFQSLGQAADSMQMLVAQAIRLRNTDEQMYPTGKITSPDSHSSPKDILLDQLETWLGLFENTLQLQSHSSGTNSGSSTLITLLRLQQKIAWIFTSSYGPGREMEYDAFLPQFQQCVALARDVAMSHQGILGSSNPTFTPEIGVLPVLYIIGAKCRDAPLRREVLDILRQQSIREAVWNSVCIAKILERIIEIEEKGCEEGLMSCMDQIAVGQRIEALSWIYVANGDSAPRLDVTYTFCGKEGVHNEVLMV